MRTTGLVEDSASPAVHDHLAWSGHGTAGLASTARRVFGPASPGERLVLLTGDGSGCGIEEDYAADLASGRLLLMSAAETFAPVLDGVADAGVEQLRAFDAVVGEALASGYSGLRVVADTTEMLAGTDEQVSNWLAWETMTDRWQARQPVNGNCYFDVARLAPDRLRAALRRHPASVGDAVSWRVHFEQDDAGVLRLALAGAVETFDEAEFVAALETSLQLNSLEREPLELTLRQADYLHHAIPFAIAGLASHGPGLRVTDVPASVARLLSHLPPLTGFAA